MLRTYEFYEKELFVSSKEIDRINKIITDFEAGIVNEEDLYRLNLDALKFCIAEGKIDTLVKLVKPIAYQDGEEVSYKYFVDAVSLGLVDYIRMLPTSIMERYVEMLRSQREESTLFAYEGELPFEEETVSIREAAHNAVILTPMDKKRLIDAILKIDVTKIGNIRIKDVFARQLSGMAHSINGEMDVAFYNEISNYIPSLALYNKNIMTTSNDTAGCRDDSEDIESKCEISIHYDSLTEANKCVADAIVESGNGYLFDSFTGTGKDLMISVPCLREEKISDVNNRMMKLISGFHKQDVLYGVISKSEAITVIKRWSTFLSGEARDQIQSMIKEDMSTSNIMKVFSELGLKYVCDQDGTIYRDKYCLARHKEYLMEQGELKKDINI